MQISIKPTVTYIVELTESELNEALVEPAALQAQLRDARNRQRISASTDHPNKFRSSGVTGDAIAAAAKKQNAKSKRPFAASDAKTKIEIPRVACPECGKMVVNTPKGWGVHKARSHHQNSSEHKPTRTPTGNTFPLSAQSVD